MKRLMRNWICFLAIFIVGFTTPALASDSQWVSGGPQQGFWWARVTSGAGNQIYVSCDVGNGSGSSINFQLAGKNPQQETVFLSFDGSASENVWLNWKHNSGYDLKGGCRACDSNFIWVTDRLKSHNRVVVTFANGDSASFTLKGSRNAIDDCPPILLNR